MAKTGPKGPFKWTDDAIDKLADKLTVWMDEPSNFWLGKFASDNKLWRQRLDEFADKSPKFADALKLAKQVQENKIVIGALGNKINCSMAIFSLKNIAMWRDVPVDAEEKTRWEKEEIEIGDNGNTPQETINRFKQFIQN